MVYKKFGPYKVSISNEDKILFPKEKITKQELINYYIKISSLMLPHLKDRPVMLQRFPGGIDKQSFYQKNAAKYFPEWIEQVKVPLKSGGFNNFTVCQNKASLVYLANQGTITFHTWLSKANKLRNPDKIVFDLDPPKNGFSIVKFTAFALKELLEKIDLKPYLMTTGSAGLHVVIPIDSAVDFKTARSFAKSCAETLISLFPEKLTLELRKEKRGNKVFIDILRNQYGATSVAPYSVRPKPTAPIATPIFWHELEEKDLKPDKFNIKNIFERIQSVQNPWKNFFKDAKSLKKSILKLKKTRV